MLKAFTVTEKRRLFLPPDPPKKGPRCSVICWPAHRCLRVEGHDGGHFVNFDPQAKFVTIRSDQ